MKEATEKILQQNRKEELERQRQRMKMYEDNELRRKKAQGLSEEEIAREALEAKIDEALLEYRRENLLGAGQLTTADWTQVYKNAGMTDEQIAAYRQEQSKYAAALNDPLDAYRS
jgi:hypothetical protein